MLTAAFIFAIASAFGGLALFHWLERRGVGGKEMKWLGPVASLFIADALFLVPLGLLSGPLAFTMEINPLGLVLSTTAIGLGGAWAEIWLKTRDRVVKLREELGDTLPRLSSRLQLLKQRVADTRAACPGIDLAPEEGLAAKCGQELAFTSDTIDEMTAEDLGQKLAQFQDLDRQLSRALDETFRKLTLYYDEDRREFNDLVRSSADYGMAVGKPAEGPVLSQLESSGFASVLDLQRQLKSAYSSAAEPLAGAVGNLEKTLRSEFDPEYRRVGLEIARNYLAQGQADEAVKTFVNELASIERQLCSEVGGLDSMLAETAGGLRAVMEGSLLPLATVLGDTEGAAYYKTIMGRVADIAGIGPERKKLPDLVDRMLKVRELADITASLIERLSTVIGGVEATIEGKVPSGYNWGKNPQIGMKVEAALNLLRRPLASADIKARVSLVRSELKTIEEEVSVVRQYAAMDEFLVNYVNIEYLVNARLETGAPVGYGDLPVKPSYARQYLRLFAEVHPREAFLEERSGMLRVRTSV